MTSRRVGFLATAALLVVTASWGSSFPMTKDLLTRVSVFDFLAVRFTIASLFLLAVAPRAVFRLTPDARRHALVLGGIYAFGQIVQTTGLERTPASVSGFITGMYVVCTPLLAAVLLHARIGAWTWVAVAISVTGLGILTLEGFSVGFGEMLILISAVLYALHIVGLGAWSQPDRALGMSILQIWVIAAVSWAAALPGGVSLPAGEGDWTRVVYLAVTAGALAMLGQTWAQAHLTAIRTAIIMTMEPVFAALFAVWMGGESVSWRMLTGGALVLAAMLTVELAPRRRIETEVQHLTA